MPHLSQCRLGAVLHNGGMDHVLNTGIGVHLQSLMVRGTAISRVQQVWRQTYYSCKTSARVAVS